MNGDHPIDGQPLLLAAAKGSVGPDRLPELLTTAQRWLADRLEEYRRSYELVRETDDCCVFFVESGHWEALRADLGLTDREADAVRRAHEAHLLFDAHESGERAEFETALDLREVVVVGKE